MFGRLFGRKRYWHVVFWVRYPNQEDWTPGSYVSAFHPADVSKRLAKKYGGGDVVVTGWQRLTEYESLLWRGSIPEENLPF